MNKPIPLVDVDFTPRRANLEVFAETVIQCARQNQDVCVVTSDSRGSGKLTGFAEAFPDRIIETGIAEQNLVGTAAGLASTGKIVFAVSPASFLTARSFEQIKNDVAYSGNPVILVGISAGVSYGPLGSTHHSLHDIAALRAVNNLDILVPADNGETAWAVQNAVDIRKPVYLRFGKKPMPLLAPAPHPYTRGEAVQFGSGGDVAFIATGETVLPAVQAACTLEERGVRSRVLSLHTIRPFDTTAIERAAECPVVITAEEHMVCGGLGEAVAGHLLQAGKHPRFAICGIPDEYTYTGSQIDIFNHYGLNAESLARLAHRLHKERACAVY